MLELNQPPGPRLLAMDLAKFYKTKLVLSILLSYNIIPSLIPPGGTGLLPPLDIVINKTVNDILYTLTEKALDLFEIHLNEDLREATRTSAVKHLCVLVQGWVAEAYQISAIEKRDVE